MNPRPTTHHPTRHLPPVLMDFRLNKTFSVVVPTDVRNSMIRKRAEQENSRPRNICCSFEARASLAIKVGALSNRVSFCSRLSTTQQPITHTTTTMAVPRNKLSKRLSKTFKRKFLPWLLKKSSKSYDELPAAHSHQEEIDENALNEALEARLMEMIASSPAQKAPVTLTQADLFDFQGTFVPLSAMTRYQTKCQHAQPQQIL